MMTNNFYKNLRKTIDNVPAQVFIDNCNIKNNIEYCGAINLYIEQMKLMRVK